MKKKVIILLLIAFFISGCSQTEPVDMTNYTKADMSGYEKLEEKYTKYFYELSLDEFRDIIESKKSAVVYFGYTECHNCQDVINDIGMLADKHKKNIFYINAMDYAEDKDKLLQLEELMADILETDEEGKKIFLTPEIFSIENGRYTKRKVGYSLEEYESIIGG